MPFTDEELKALAHGQQKPVTDIDKVATDTDFLRSLGQMQQSGQTPQGLPATASPSKPMLTGGAEYNFVQDILDVGKSWANRMGGGNRQLTNSIRGSQMLFGGVDPNSFRKGESRVQLDDNYQNDFIAKHFDNIAGPAIETIPSFTATIGGGAAGAGAGAGVGALAGLAGGPLAEVTVPGGIATGAKIGFDTGVFTTAASLAAGDMYTRMREEDITDDKARPASIVYGVIAGALNSGAMHLTGQIGKSAIKEWMASPAARGVITRLLVNAGVNTGAGTIQDMSDKVISTLVGTSEGKTSLVTKDWQDALIKALGRSALTGGVMAVGVEGGGAAIGTALHKFAKTPKPDVALAADAVAEAANHTGLPKELQAQIETAETAMHSAHDEYQAALTEFKKNHGNENEQHSVALNKLAHEQPEIAKAKKRLSEAKTVLRSLQETSRKSIYDTEELPTISKTYSVEQEQQWKEYNEKVADQNFRDKVVNGIAQAVRVLPGAINEVAANARKAIRERRALTEDEKLALERVKLPDNAAAARNRFDNIWGNYFKANLPGSRVYGYKSVNQGGLLLIAAQDIPHPEAIVKQFDTFVAENEAGRRGRLYDDMWHEALQNSTGLDKSQVEKLAFDAKNTLIEDKYIGRQYFTKFARGKAAENDFSLTADEIMSYLIWKKNPEARPGLEHGNGFTFVEDFASTPDADSFEAVARRRLKEANPLFEKAMEAAEATYKRLYEPLAETEARQGRQLDQLEGYGGKITRRGDPAIDTMPDDLIPRLPWQSAAELPEGRPAFTQQRTRNLREVMPRGLFENMQSRIVRQAQYEAMIEPAKLWQQLVSDPTFSHATQVKYGRDFLNTIRRGYRDIVHGSSTLAESQNKWVDGLMKARLIQVLGVKPMQAVKHLTTVFNGALYKLDGKFIPSHEYLAGLADFAHNSEEAINTITNFDAYKTRYANPAHTITGAVVRGTKDLTVARLEKASTVPFVVGDKGALLPLTWSIYKYALKKTGDAGKAEIEASRAFNDVLASGMMGQLSDFGRNQVTKLFAQFQQPAMRLAQHNLEAMRKAANFPTKENINGALYTNLVTRASMALFVAPEIAAAYLLTRDDKVRDEKVHHFFQEMRLGALFPMSKIGMSSIDTIITNNMYNKHNRVFEPNVAPLEMLDNAFHRLPMNIARHTIGGEQLTPLGVFQMAIQAIQGSGAPVPLEIVKAARMIFADPNSTLYIGDFFHMQSESKGREG